MFSLEQVVPWGRSFDEYRRMFALTDAELAGRLLGCGDGPASFNAEASRRASAVVSCDPLYLFTPAEIESRVNETCDTVLRQLRDNADHFVWDTFDSVEAVGATRLGAMRTFLRHFSSPGRRNRYVAAALPHLPFATGAFDIAVCSHFLFLYSAHFDEAFHHAALAELCRVAREVRVFPLVALNGAPSPYLPACLAALRSAGHDVHTDAVPYEFQRGANQMLRIASEVSSRF